MLASSQQGGTKLSQVETGWVSEILEYARDEAIESATRDVSGYFDLMAGRDAVPAQLTLKPSSTRINIIWRNRPGGG